MGVYKDKDTDEDLDVDRDEGLDLDKDLDRDWDRGKGKAVTKGNPLKGGNMTDDAYQAECEANVIYQCQRCGVPCRDHVCAACRRGGDDDFYSRYYG